MRWKLRIPLDEFAFIEAESNSLEELADAQEKVDIHPSFRDRVHRPDKSPVVHSPTQEEKSPQKRFQYTSEAPPKKVDVDATCPKCGNQLRIIKQGANRRGPWYVFGCKGWRKDGNGCDYTVPSWEEEGKDILPF